MITTLVGMWMCVRLFYSTILYFEPHTFTYVCLSYVNIF